MKTTKKVSFPKLALATGVVLLGFGAVPSQALTPPELQVAVTGASVTIDSTGAQAYTGTCSAQTCPGTATVGSGTVSWSGSIGDFTISTLTGRTKPSLDSPNIDLGIGSIMTGATGGGTITISWTDINFTVGSSPGTMNIVAGGVGSAVYTSYVDDSNTAFGTGIQVGTTGNGGIVTGLGPTATGDFSMTNVEVLTLPAGLGISLPPFSNDFSLQVSPSPPLTLGCGTASAQYGVAYSSGLVVNGGTAPYSYSITAGSLPGGLALNPLSGQISGTPTVAGATFNFTAQVMDSSGLTGANTVAASCAIVIPPTTNGGGQTTLTLACPSTTTGKVGSAYSGSLVAAGGLPPYTFSIATGTLAAPLTLNPSTGGITGTPTSPGTSTFTAKVVDSATPTKDAATSATCGVTISPVGSPVVSGDAATIGFWHNKNGQALILALNGSASSKSLANWLASSFPYLYGVHSSNDLTNQTNTAVAALFLEFFGAGGQKTDAQIMSGALASYVTSSTLGGTTGTKYGFNSSTAGTGAKVYNVGSNGSALGLVNNQTYTVLQLLQQANLTESNGTYNANALNTVFNDINTTGDIN